MHKIHAHKRRSLNHIVRKNLKPALVIPKKPSVYPFYLDPIDFGTYALLDYQDSMIYRKALSISTPRAGKAKNQKHATDSTDPEDNEHIGKKVLCRGKVSGRGARVTSPIHCHHRATLSPAEETSSGSREDRQAETTCKGSRMKVRGGRGRRSTLSRGITRPQGTEGALKEVPDVSQRKTKTSGVSKTGKDKEPGSGGGRSRWTTQLHI